MQMATVMMSTTMKPAFLMEEIVVDLMSIQIGVQNVNALNEGKAKGQLISKVLMKNQFYPKYQRKYIWISALKSFVAFWGFQ